jgi:hypothetical protein
MTNDEFRLWLNGFSSLENPEHRQLNKNQLRIIINHLNFTRAAEGYLDAKNKWLDHFLLEQLSKPDTPKTLVFISSEIFRRYGQLKTDSSLFSR